MNLIAKISALAFGLALILPATAVKAATPESVQISPLTYKFEVGNNASKDATITIKNLTKSSLSYSMEAENFNNVTDDGAPVSFETSDDASKGLTLADWITFPSVSGTLVAGEKKTLGFNIKVPTNAQPGGYYAAVFVRTVPLDDTNSQLGVIGRVGTLILVTVPGNISKTVRIDQFSIPGFVGNLGVKKDFSAKISNTGGTYFESRVVAEIKPLIGKVSTVDLGTHLMTQGNARSFAGSWGNKYPFGPYKVTVKAFDGEGKFVTASGSFWALPYEIALPALLLLIGLIVTPILIIKRRSKKQ